MPPTDNLVVRDFGATTIQQFINGIGLRTFPNRLAEDEFTSRAERIVRNEGTRIETMLVKQAEERHAAMKQLGADSDAVGAAMRDVQKHMAAGQITAGDAFDEFERLAAAGARIVQQAIAQPNAVEQLLDKLGDPIAALDDLQSRYSTLRRVYEP